MATSDPDGGLMGQLGLQFVERGRAGNHSWNVGFRTDKHPKVGSEYANTCRRGGPRADHRPDARGRSSHDRGSPHRVDPDDGERGARAAAFCTAIDQVGYSWDDWASRPANMRVRIASDASWIISPAREATMVAPKMRPPPTL